MRPLATVHLLLHAARRLRNAPLFSVMSVLTLAIGIGASALMLSVVSTILLKPLPYGEPERIEMVWGSYPDANLGVPEQPTHGAVFSIIRDNIEAFESIAAFRGASLNLGDSTAPERLDGVAATGEFFRALGVTPARGRFFERANESPGEDHVVVLSDALWRRRFGAETSIIGRVLTLNGEPYTVIGVARAGFAFPRGSEMPGDFQFAATPELWVPLKPPQEGIADLAIVGRLKAGITHLAARQDMDRVMAVVERSIPVVKNSKPRALLVPLRKQVVGDVTEMLLSLIGGVALVLLIACVNTAQLLLARLQARRREVAMRAALGATRLRLAGEVMAEIALLVAAGGAAGIALGSVGIDLLRAYGTAQLPRAAELAFDARFAAAALGVVVIAAVAVSLVPLVLGSGAGGGADLMTTLRSGGPGAGASGISGKARRALIVSELAGSLVLVASAGLLVRSLSQQMNAKLGFDAVHGATFEVSLPPIRYPERAFDTGMEHPAAVQFLGAALDNIRALPGVSAAGIGKPLPLSGEQQASVFTPEGELPSLPPEAFSPIAQFTVASQGMIRALGATMLAGRDFSDADRAEGVPVVIVNESMAAWLWPGKNAVGRRLHVGGPRDRRPFPWMTVIGVMGNMKRYALTETPRPEMIVPYTQNPYLTFGTMQFVVRSNLQTAALMPEIQRAIAAADPSIPIAHPRTIDDLVATSAANARFVTRFMESFGLVALLLTIVGVYGVIAYSVQQRRQEFAVRRALGATTREILRLVLAEGLALAAVGVAIGLSLTVAAGLSLRHLLFGVSPFDLVTLLASMVVIAGLALAASLVPAVAAARVEPRAALEE
jgi:predicted permease